MNSTTVSDAAGRDLTLHGVNTRLKVVEIILFISLVLNVVAGYMAAHSEKRVTQVEQQTGVQK